jgi:ribosomal protein S18 acetylase RimI-like enzyme
MLHRILAGSGRFGGMEDIEEHLVEGPWRVRVNGRGEAALVERWRDHLPYLAIEGLYCEEVRAGDLLRDVAELAVERGLECMLSPLVDPERAQPYRAAGFRTHREVVFLWLDGVRLSRRLGPERSVVFGSPEDGEAVLAIDAACFEPFWRFDRRVLTRLARTDRLLMARDGDRVVGYALAGLTGRDGRLGRIAVTPEARGRGIGRALLMDALAELVRQGAQRVVLVAEPDNGPALRLYRSVGFRAASQRLSMLLSDTLVP